MQKLTAFVDSKLLSALMQTQEKQRPLGLWSLLALGINGIVGVGIFFTPSSIAALAPGWSSLIVVGVTGLALVPVALAVSTMGRRFDEDGGPVLYARMAFGDAAGFIVGWLAYTAALFSMSAVYTGFMSANLRGVGPWGVRLAAIGLLTVLTLVASTGVKVSARVWSGLTVLKLLPLIGLAIIAIFAFPTESPNILNSHPSVDPNPGETHWLRAALTATFVFQGFEIVPVVAGQAKASSRTIPIAVLGSLGISTAIYLLLFRGLIVGVHDVAHSGSPLVDMAKSYGGTTLERIVSIGLNVSSLGIAFGMIVTTPRFLSALAPKSRFAKENDRGIPTLALLTTYVVVAVMLLGGNIGELLMLSSLGVVMQYLLVAVALAKFAYKRERGLTPIRAWSAIPTVIVALALMNGAGAREWAVAVGCGVLGAAIYFGQKTIFAE